MNARSRLICSLGLAGSLAAGHALLASGQAPPRPQFKSGVDVIAIDVNIVDRTGQPIGGLTPEQFEVQIDGKPRRVASAVFLDYAAAAAAQAAKAPLEAHALRLDTSYSSNEKEDPATATPGRVIVLAVDQLSFAPGAARAAAESAKQFLGRLGPADRVGLAAYPPPGPSIAPTIEHQVVRNALDRVLGMADTTQSISPYISLSEAVEIDRGDAAIRQQVIERECAGLKQSMDPGLSGIDSCVRRIDVVVPQLLGQLEGQARRSLNGLQSIINELERMSGSKTLVVVSRGLVPASSAHLDLRGDIQAVAESAAAANVRVYVLHVARGLLDAFSAEMRRGPETAFQDETLMASGLQMLAGMSAGTLFTVAAAADAAFDRVARESSASYVLGVEPEPGDRDGKSHRIQVRVNKVPNAIVRSRTSFVVPSASAAPATPEAAVAAALKPGRLARDLPVQFAAYTLRDPDSGQLRIVMAANVGRGVTGPADLRVGYAISDQTGRVIGAAVDKMRLEPRGTGPTASWSFLSAIGVRPGVYTIRLAAADADGNVGSIERRVEAKLEPGNGVAISDLLLFDPRRPPKQDWKTAVDGRIDGTSAELAVEVYPVKTKGPSSVAFDIADRPDGPALVGTRATPVAAASNRRWLAAAYVDLRLLPPGDYVAIATVYDNDRKLGSVSRPFRLEPPVATGDSGPRAELGIADSGGLLRGFERKDVLTPDALEFFLRRLKETDEGEATDALATAAASVRDGQFDGAIAALQNASPDRLSVPFLKGLALFGRGDLEPAAAEFREALRLSSEFLPAAFYLGACYAAGGRDREAVGAWQTSLVSESDARIVFDVLADAWLRVGDGKQAESIAQEAIGRWPGDDRFLPRLAAAQAMQNRRGDALDTLAPYLARHADDTAALFLALRVLYDAHAAGRPVKDAADDALQATKYGTAYKSAGGPRAALVDRWVTFIQR